jgi:hypothetical protein
MVQEIVKRIGRARYRAEVGVCERVEPVHGTPKLKAIDGVVRLH